MDRLLIGAGLTNAYLGEGAAFEDGRKHVGARERERLLGGGQELGAGPLCALLRGALNAGVPTLLLQSAGDEAERLPAPLAFLEESAELARLSTTALPAAVFEEKIRDPGQTVAVVVGCHTEAELFALANYLKNGLGVGRVCVSPYFSGSPSREAHLAAFRHYFLVAGVEVLLDPGDIEAALGMALSAVDGLGLGACRIEPAETAAQLQDEQRRIVELLCMHWDEARLRSLAGGFSGSQLFIATGQKGRATTEPLVLKIDSYLQMRRELNGYYRVKDFLGKHVPTFGFPVSLGSQLGVAMELAAMEGSPETMQDSFEAAESEAQLDRFYARLDKTLGLLAEKLYRNTQSVAAFAPYRQLGLHTRDQQGWLEENAALIGGYLEELGASDYAIDAEQLRRVLQVISKNEDTVDAEVCLVHGDLNLANVICDEGDNVWFIDWTHCGVTPVELDFAKIENDIKFVMSKEFELEDLPRLRRFEEMLLNHPIPPDVTELPDDLKFAKWDLRYRKILGAVRRIRAVCFSLTRSEDWLVYRIALLRYALHTLSFDERRGRGECSVTQLALALHSTEALLLELIAADFHLKTRAERPSSYPPRQRVSIDEAHWLTRRPSTRSPTGRA
jgi:hypothetical protein